VKSRQTPQIEIFLFLFFLFFVVQKRKEIEATKYKNPNISEKQFIVRIVIIKGHHP